MDFLAKIFGTKSSRELKKLHPIVSQINEFEASLQQLSDDQLRAKTDEFKQRLAAVKNAGVSDDESRDEAILNEKKEILDDLLPEAFAVVREAARRTLGMRHFDVQLMGGMVLHEGKIAEMKTGEGKTLVATLPVYLNALDGQGRARRHGQRLPGQARREWMGRIYRFLGLTVGVHRQHDMDDQRARRPPTPADITYGTNNEFGFDYLRDNMKFDLRATACSASSTTPSWTRWTPS